MIGDYNNGSSSSSSGASGSAGSSVAVRHKARNVVFNIHFKYDVHKIIIPDQADVGKWVYSSTQWCLFMGVCVCVL